MKLIITEKPSVAQSIALVLGAKSRKDGYLEGGGYIISWCLGHLFELARAESYNEKYAKWKREDLPIICFSRTNTHSILKRCPVFTTTASTTPCSSSCKSQTLPL